MAAVGSGGSGRRLRLVIAILMASVGLYACGASDTETSAGANATLAWDAVTDPNLSGYRIYYGSAPGTYLQSVGQGVNVGNVTTYILTGLSSETRYYFAVTAYDFSGRESTYSNEVFKDFPCCPK